MSFFFLLNPKNTGGSGTLLIPLTITGLTPYSTVSTFTSIGLPLMQTVNEQIDMAINVGTSGYANADFTKAVFRNGVPSTETVSVAETSSSGWYRVTFTPARTGLYMVEVYYTSASTTKWVGTFNVESADTTQTHLSHIRSILNRIEDALRKFRLKK